jgi:hypothetical protein
VHAQTIICTQLFAGKLTNRRFPLARCIVVSVVSLIFNQIRVVPLKPECNVLRNTNKANLLLKFRILQYKVVVALTKYKSSFK